MRHSAIDDTSRGRTGRTVTDRVRKTAALYFHILAIGAFAAALMQLVGWFSVLVAGPINCTVVGRMISLPGFLCVSDTLQGSLVNWATVLMCVGIIVTLVLFHGDLHRTSDPDHV